MQEDVAATVIALERGALDRWGKGDPQGYVEIYAPELTYFDPMQETRVDGLDAMKAVLAPFAGKVRVDRYDMKDAVVARWNATAVYRAVDGTWKSIHVHWSFIKPELKTPVSEEVSSS